MNLKSGELFLASGQKSLSLTPACYIIIVIPLQHEGVCMYMIHVKYVSGASRWLITKG
jgi:hypothetical protein